MIAPRPAKCPYCGQRHYIYEDADDDSVRIICPNCHQSFCVDCRTLRTRKRVDDNDTALNHKLTCPRCKKHHLLYESKVDEILSIICPKCGCYFRGNLLYGKTWETKPQKDK